MTKRVKKGLTIAGIIVGVILVLMITLPFLFKEKIKDAAINAANDKLNAKVVIGDFGLNFFSNFPNATLSLNNVSIVGIGDFEKDTLLQTETGSITIDLFSLWGNNYTISKINLNKASVYAKILADGRTNWDIMKADSTASTAKESNTPFKMDLKNISLSNCNVVYEDFEGKMKAVLNDWTGTISGDFSASETTLKTNSTIHEVSYLMNGIAYLNKAKGTMEATINANFDKMKFTFIDSKLQLNELKASIDGSFAMVGEEGMNFDLKLKAPDTQFKDILSLVPAMYTADFKEVKTAGKASVDASIKGLMEGEVYPAFDVKIQVSDAMFQYPSLPKSVNAIHVNMAISSKGGSLDNTIIDISRFTFNLGGNPFAGSVHISTPITDANIKAKANGTLDLGMIKEVYPLQKGTELNGRIVADIQLATAMSSIEKEQYDKVSAAGHLKLNNMLYKSKDMPDVLVNNAALEFTPQYVNLSSLDVKIGKNDISATGRLENFIAYALKDKTLKGQLSIKSNYLNADDFMGSETGGEASSTASADGSMSIPKNIDFSLNAAMKQVIYTKVSLTNMVGTMSIKDGILTLKDVSANTLGGSAKISGTYNNSDPKNEKVNFAINLSKVSFQETFKNVESIQKLAPIFENLIGTYSMNLNFNTSLGATIMQTLTNLTGSGGLQTSDVRIENNTTLTALSSALKTDALKSFSTKDLNIPFSIDNGRILTKAFNVNLGDGGLMKLQGSTGLDQSIDYKGTVTLPKAVANKYVSNLGITIGGTFAKPKIGIDTNALINDAVGSIVGSVLGGSGDTSAKLGEEKSKQIERIRSEADKAANTLVEEAQKQSDALVSKAGNNPIAKAAAKVGANQVVAEAKKQAQKMRDAAEEQIKKLD